MAERKKKSANQKLEEEIFLKRRSGWRQFVGPEREKVFGLAEQYKKFMAASKTERLCVRNIIAMLEENGFRDLAGCAALTPGDRVYRNLRGKAVVAAVVGVEPASFNLIGSHVDSPRLDLKPSPLYEEAELAMLQSHYYGGIKKYHWVNTPLALHGVAFTRAGDQVAVHVGENDDEPKFIIPDLLPHLAREQMKKEAAKVVEAEDLNILCGHLPVDDEEIKEKVKFTVLQYLFDTHGLVEEDFNCAELELVPATRPMDIGFDRGLVAAYGQDDRVCVFTSLMALIAIENPARTALGLFVDKEEIGSVGNTGADGFLLLNFTREYARLAGLASEPHAILENSRALSADVTAAFDPTYKSVSDPQNAAYAGRGVSIEKYGGSKRGSNDTHAEYMAWIRQLLTANKIPWQAGELGRIDAGGGGTIASFLSRYGMDCVDAGPGVLGMHSPCEVTSKADIYSAYLLYKAFFGS